MTKRRILGWLVMAAVWVPALLLIMRGTPRLPLPFVAVLVIAALAILAVLKVAYQLRARVDPSFDPSLSAHRSFQRGWLLQRKG
jgi:hypothetical protein